MSSSTATSSTIDVSKSFVSRLPRELLLHIFTYLRPLDWERAWHEGDLNGKADLDACSRVSFCWNAAALPHLFHSVIWTPHGHPIRLPLDGDMGYPRSRREQLEWKMSRYAKRGVATLSSFLLFLGHHPIAAQYLREFRLDTWTIHTYEPPKIPMDTLFAVLKAMPNLQTLHLHGYMPPSGTTRYRDRSVQGINELRTDVSQLRELKKLTIRFMIFHDPRTRSRVEAVTEFLSKACTLHLDELTLDILCNGHCFQGGTGGQVGFLDLCRPQLDSLEKTLGDIIRSSSLQRIRVEYSINRPELDLQAAFERQLFPRLVERRQVIFGPADPRKWQTFQVTTV